MNNLSKLPIRLKELMQEKELNAAKLAKDLKIEQSVISKFLKGQRLPSLATLVKLADYFNCTTDYLLGETDILDDRAFKQRPPFEEQLSFLLKYFNKTKYRLKFDAEVAEDTINNWHKGKYEPNIENLLRLKKAFDCSLDFIIGREI